MAYCYKLINKQPLKLSMSLTFKLAFHKHIIFQGKELFLVQKKKWMNTQCICSQNKLSFCQNRFWFFMNANCESRPTLLHIVPFCEGPNEKPEGFAKQKQSAIFAMRHASQLVMHHPLLIYNVPLIIAALLQHIQQTKLCDPLSLRPP